MQGLQFNKEPSNKSLFDMSLACEVTGALDGIENGAKMWSLFAVRANMLKVNLRFLKQRRIIVINQIYMIVSFLFLKSMSFIRYLHRSEEKKRRHGDNNVALETTFWCVALRKSCPRRSYTCAVELHNSTHDWVKFSYSSKSYIALRTECTVADKSCSNKVQ